MVDAGDLKSPDGNIVGVRFPPRAPLHFELNMCGRFLPCSVVSDGNPAVSGLAKPARTWPERRMIRWITCFIAALWSVSAWAGEVTVAVASNFLTTAEEIARVFEADTGHSMVVSHGSTGLLYAQISAGAPFDVLLAADAERPARLMEDGKALKVGTYALGRLVLIGREAFERDTIQQNFDGRTVALADPTVAPYGRAATFAMERLGLDTATFRPVLVSNVGQVASIFATGNADFAFVAAAQLPLLNPAHVMALEGIAPTIQQDAALLRDDNPAADAFWNWLFSDKGHALIEGAGYDAP